MSFEIVNPEGFPRPSGFSYAIATSGQKLLFVAGQTAQDASGVIIGAGDMVQQFERILANISRILDAGHTSPDHVVKMTIFVTNVAMYKENSRPIGAIYRKYFGQHYPAMTLVEVRKLYDDEALLEIEVVAVVS